MITTVLTNDQIRRKASTLTDQAALNAFLRDVEARAYRITLMAVRDADEALDIVQDAMIKLARNYASRESAEWPPLFYRILQNRTRDWHRRQSVRRRVMGFFTRNEDDEDPIETAPGPASDDPIGQLQRDDTLAALEVALAALPKRQHEAFVLRNFEGLDVKQTASAMGCSDGSVKTHYSRAIAHLRKSLGEHWS